MNLVYDVRQDGVATITLQRPHRLNALTWEMVEDLHRTFADVSRDPRVRVLVITGSGRGFCAGLDIQSDDPLGLNEDLEYPYRRQERVAGLTLALRDLPQPVIAAVNGPASGGGLALALAADVRVCSVDAAFNVAFVRIGLSGCDIGVSHLLPRIVGAGIASELLLTGDRVDAARAERIGLANRVVPAETLREAVDEFAAKLIRNSPFALRMTKQVLRRNLEAGSLEAAIELENRTQILATRTRDAPEALGAFLDRRDARFTGTGPGPR